MMRGIVIYVSLSQRSQMEKGAQPFGLRLKERHSLLLVTHLGKPNIAPRA
jgi:hypothetical protein